MGEKGELWHNREQTVYPSQKQMNKKDEQAA